MLSTDQKGTIAEYGIAWQAMRLGIDVYKPLSDGTRCDLIFDLGGRLTRVQCKWAARHGEVLRVACYRNRRTRNGLLRRAYTADEVDAFAAYCLELDTCYFIPYAHFPNQPYIHLRPGRRRTSESESIGLRNTSSALPLGPWGRISWRAPPWHGGGQVRSLGSIDKLC